MCMDLSCVSKMGLFAWINLGLSIGQPDDHKGGGQDHSPGSQPYTAQASAAVHYLARLL